MFLEKVFKPAPRTPADKSRLLKESKHFCMLPWLSLQIRPNGAVYPCCLAQTSGQLGDAKKTSLSKIWNSNQLRKIRKKMLKDEPVSACNYCYQLEKNTEGSFRKKFNEDFAHHFDSVVPYTSSNGRLNDFKLRYWDFRLSNFCNLKCRSCGHDSSSSWYSDSIKLKYPPASRQAIERVADYRPQIIDDLLSQLPYVEEIYFAGGEPLIMEEHYKILQSLIHEKRTDVRIWYNTNFSTLKWKGVDVTELWKQFPDIRIQASLDDSYERGEYIRKGLKWDKVVANRMTLKEKCPHVQFQVSPTVSCYNVWHIPDFLIEWMELGFIGEDDFNLNPLYGPSYMTVHVLPRIFRQKVWDKYQVFSDTYLSGRSAKLRVENLQNWLLEKDDEQNSKEFKIMTGKLDTIRNESFKDIFPEIAFMMD